MNLFMWQHFFNASSGGCYNTQHDLHDIMCCVPYTHLLPKYSF
jgi:hypothetical protein